METGKNKKVVVTRVLNAPRELVFKAWTDAKELAKWWGPTHFTNPVCRADAKPGGEIYIDMKAPDGTVYPMVGRFIEIIKPEKIVFISGPLDEAGELLFEIMNTITLTEQDGKTTLTVIAEVTRFRTEGMHHINGMEQGWNQSLTKLAILVEN